MGDTTTTVSVNGGPPTPLDEMTPERLADDLGWTEDGQSEAFPETPEEKAARIRISLKDDVLAAQDACVKAASKLASAQETRAAAESVLLAFDELTEALGPAAAVEHHGGDS